MTQAIPFTNGEPRCTTCHRAAHKPGTFGGHWFTTDPGARPVIAAIDALEDAADAAEAGAAMDEPGESTPLADLIAEFGGDISEDKYAADMASRISRGGWLASLSPEGHRKLTRAALGNASGMADVWAELDRLIAGADDEDPAAAGKAAGAARAMDLELRRMTGEGTS